MLELFRKLYKILFEGCVWMWDFDILRISCDSLKDNFIHPLGIVYPEYNIRWMPRRYLCVLDANGVHLHGFLWWHHILLPIENIIIILSLSLNFKTNSKFSFESDIIYIWINKLRVFDWTKLRIEWTLTFLYV